MERRYRKLVRKVRTYLRKEQRKNSFWSRFITEKAFCPSYWKWQRQSVSIGAGWGAAFAISPLPMQTIWAMLSCVWKKGNIPIAVLAALLSPPGFAFVSIPSQWLFGTWLLSFTPIESSGLSFEVVKNTVGEALKQVSFSPLKAITSEIGFWHLMLEFALGAVISCVVLGLFCYLATQGIWRVIAYFAARRKTTRLVKQEGNQEVDISSPHEENNDDSPANH